MSNLMQNYTSLIRLLIHAVIHPTQIHGGLGCWDVLREVSEDRPIASGAVARDPDHRSRVGSCINEGECDACILGPFDDVSVDLALLAGRTDVVTRKVRVRDSLRTKSFR